MTEINSIVEEAAAMFTELIALQKSYNDRLIAMPQPDFNNEEIARVLGGGETIISRYGLQPDADLYQELQQDIIGLIAKHRTGKEMQVEKIGVYIKAHPDLYKEILDKRTLAMPDGLSLEEKELLDFIIAQTLRPWFQVFAAWCSQFVDQEQWLRAYCPVCGEKATISYLRGEDGKRMLVCPLCGTEWQHKYLACSWCGHEDHHDLSFFEVAEIPGYEVYLCEKCHGYLKTLNEKKRTGHRDWLLEDVNTLILDMLALQRGYNNSGQKTYM
ncbi:MAG: formate dehydrogenase accessory protein FdhE [Thermacetogeniaceae bacterium]